VQVLGDVGAQATITGGASSVVSSDLTIDRALISNGSGKIAVSGTTSTEIGYLSGVSSGIQSQFSGKEASIAKSVGYLTWNGANWAFFNEAYSLTSHTHTGYQPVDGDLTAIAAIAGTSGLLRKTATDTWSLDTSTYLPLTAGVSKQLTGSLILQASSNKDYGASVNLPHGTTPSDYYLYNGDLWTTTSGLYARINSVTKQIVFTSDIGSYQPLDPTLTALAALDGSTGFLYQTGSDTFVKRDYGGSGGNFGSSTYVARVDHVHTSVYEPANANIQSHITNYSNPHSTTKSHIGLGSVENTALSTWGGTTNITTVGTLTGTTLVAENVISRTVILQVYDKDTFLPIGSKVMCFVIPETLNGWKIDSFGARVHTASTGTYVSIGLTNSNSNANSSENDIIGGTNKLRIDVNEYDSINASVPYSTPLSNVNVNTGYLITVKIHDNGASTAAKGLWIRIKFIKQ